MKIKLALALGWSMIAFPPPTSNCFVSSAKEINEAEPSKASTSWQGKADTGADLPTRGYNDTMRVC